MTTNPDRARIDDLQESLEALRDSLEHATGSAERVVEETERHGRVSLQCAERRQRAAEIAARIQALREVIEWQTRQLGLLRARLRLLQGRHRPH
jgi:hypothetical protein